MVSGRVFNACFFGISIPLIVLMVVAALVFFLPLEPSELKVGSDTTIWLNFTGPNLTVGGGITVIYTNPKEILDVIFENVSISVYYNVTNSTTDQLLASTYLPSIYLERGCNWKYTSLIHIDVGTVNNTAGFRSGLANFSLRLSASMSFSGITLFHHAWKKFHTSFSLLSHL